MSLIITKEEVLSQIDKWIAQIKQGNVFIYPTDTVYGIGCNALVDNGVGRIRDIKSQFKRPFSVIAPSVDWIREHCEVPVEAEEWLEKLPGPITLILNLKEKDLLSEKALIGSASVGVRIPDHWFSKVVAEVGYPVITTSANYVGENYMTSVEDLNPEIKSKVDFIIYEGEKTGTPSDLIDCSKGNVCVTKR